MRITLLIILLLSAFMAYNQEVTPDTVIELDGVTISAYRETLFTQGLKVTRIDPAAVGSSVNNSVGDLITRKTSVFVKSYGQGSIATISMRGTGANHTGVLWNGLNVSLPSTGITDLSLVKSVFFEDVALVYGGSSTIYGSGMIGGAVLLGGRPSFRNEGDIRLGFSIGSFGNKEGLISVRTSNQGFYSRTVAAISGAVNDFPYENLSGENTKLEHASVQSAGFLHDMAFVTGKDSYLRLGAWYQDTRRDIPPTLVMSSSEAVLEDRFIRMMAGWYIERESWELRLTGGYFNELETYLDPVAEVDSRIYNQSALFQVNNRFRVVRNHQLLAGWSARVDIAEIDAYGETQTDLRSSLYASYLAVFPAIRWKASLGGRLVTNRDFAAAFLPSIGVDGKIWANTHIRLNISRNYRAPTLNERYWIPGGNIDLRPEISWNAEAGLDYRGKTGNWELEVGAAGYSYLVDDWILWVPDGALWYAENVLKVWSRGLEISGKQMYSINDKWQLSFSESYQYTRSTREKRISPNDEGLGKQLIYTPVHQGNIGIEAGYGNYRLSIDSRATGKVYTTTDNESSIPGYILADVTLSAQYPIRQHNLDISFAVLNLFDEDYMIIEYRPMPGISFMASVNLLINTKKKAQ